MTTIRMVARAGRLSAIAAQTRPGIACTPRWRPSPASAVEIRRAAGRRGSPAGPALLAAQARAMAAARRGRGLRRDRRLQCRRCSRRLRARSDTRKAEFRTRWNPPHSRLLPGDPHRPGGADHLAAGQRADRRGIRAGPPPARRRVHRRAAVGHPCQARVAASRPRPREPAMADAAAACPGRRVGKGAMAHPRDPRPLPQLRGGRHPAGTSSPPPTN